MRTAYYFELKKIRTLEIYIFLLGHCQSVSGTGIKTFLHVSPHPSLDRRPHIWKKGIFDSF